MFGVNLLCVEKNALKKVKCILTSSSRSYACAFLNKNFQRLPYCICSVQFTDFGCYSLVFQVMMKNQFAVTSL